MERQVIDVDVIVDDKQGLVAYLAKPVDPSSRIGDAAGQIMAQLRVADAAIERFVQYNNVPEREDLRGFAGAYVPRLGIGDHRIDICLDNVVIDTAVYAATDARYLTPEQKEAARAAYWGKVKSSIRFVIPELSTAMQCIRQLGDWRLSTFMEPRARLEKDQQAWDKATNPALDRAPNLVLLGQSLREAALAGLLPVLEREGYDTSAYGQ